MAFVQSGADGAVTGEFGGPQPGNPACIEVADDDARLLAFRAAQHPAKPQSITGSEFINRFTPAEQGALAAAAQDPAKPQMLLMMIRLAAATAVDLRDLEVQGGVWGLVASGILTADRVNVILDH